MKNKYFNEDEIYFLVQYMCELVGFTDNLNFFLEQYKKFKKRTDGVKTNYMNKVMCRRRSLCTTLYMKKLL